MKPPGRNRSKHNAMLGTGFLDYTQCDFGTGPSVPGDGGSSGGGWPSSAGAGGGVRPGARPSSSGGAGCGIGWGGENIEREGQVNGAKGGFAQSGLAPPAGPSGPSRSSGAAKSGHPTKGMGLTSSGHTDGSGEGNESEDGEEGEDPESKCVFLFLNVNLSHANIANIGASIL